jgi:uncharacterized protein (TIGR03437 family)
LEITDAAPSISVQPASPYSVNWQMNQAQPQLSLTVFSTSTVPVPFTAVLSSTPTELGATNWLTTDSPVSPNNYQGIAYGWGVSIPLVIGQNAYTLAQAGETMTGSVAITWATGSKTIAVNIVVSAPPAAISGLSPSSVPVLATAVPGTVTIAVNGSNFVQGITKVFTGIAANLVVCSACTVQVLNSQNMTVAIPYDNTGVPFKSASVLTIGVANGATNTPQSTKNLAVTAAPIITSITSASTLAAPASGSNPTVAPYDVISIFGSNFCPASVAQCANPMVATLDSFFRYPTYLSPDGTHKLAIMFSRTATIGTAWANVPGYLLFATNNQINAVVPAGISAQLGTATVKVVVSFDTSATNPSTADSSSGFALNVAAYDPGVFTLDSTGEGAILDNNILVTTSTPATGGTDTVAIYMTGLGIPNSSGSDAGQGAFNPPTTCLAPIGLPGSALAAPTGYMGAVNTGVSGGTYTPPAGYVAPNPAWSSIDGAVIRLALLSTNVSAPCLGGAPNTLPVVTIGGQAAAVAYAGFVADSVAGLYQVNVAVPNVGNGIAAQYPVVVTMGAVTAPTVQIWVQ